MDTNSEYRAPDNLRRNNRMPVSMNTVQNRSYGRHELVTLRMRAEYPVVGGPSERIAFLHPVAEMTTHTATEIAAELMNLAYDKVWISWHKRPLIVGDTVQIGDDVWMYIAKDEIQKMSIERGPVLTWPGWSEVALCLVNDGRPKK